MTLRVAVPDLISPSYFPAIAAVELGFFKRQGLDAGIELVFPVTDAYAALRDGELDFVAGAAHAPLYAFQDWSGCRLLCALSQHMYWFLVVSGQAGAKRGDLEAIRGLRIGAAPGPVDGLRRLLQTAGIDPDTDVHIQPIPGVKGAGTSFGVAAATALEQGLIDGFWANGMGAEVARRQGATVVLDARRDEGLPGVRDCTFAALVTRDQRIESQPDEAAAAVRAIVDAQRALQRQPSLATQAARQLFPPKERALIAELIARDAPFYQPAITPTHVAALNAFGRSLGLLSTDQPSTPAWSPVLAHATDPDTGHH